MIKKLLIRNFAIIKELDIVLKDGLTVITGETGAGKSLILKSLSILLGGKGDRTYVRTGSEKSVLEVEIDSDSNNIYRRLIRNSGRVRSFINDEPVLEKDYSTHTHSFADFHGQNEQQMIMNPASHIDYLDSFCGHAKDLVRIELIFDDMMSIEKVIRSTQKKIDNSSTRKELLDFQINEIEEIKPEVNEDLDLSNEFKRLRNIEELASTIKNINMTLTENDHSIYRQLSSALSDLERLSRYDRRLSGFIQDIKEASVSIQDSSSSLMQYVENLDSDDSQLAAIEDRLHSIETLKRKYGGSIEAVNAYIENAYKELEEIKGLDKKIKKLIDKKTLLVDQYQSLSDKLHLSRMKTAENISKQIVKEMSNLNMDRAVFDIRIQQSEKKDSPIVCHGKNIDFKSKGYDSVEFYLSANPGESPKPLAKIASGGETSRIMLAIKSVLKSIDPVSTLIFDEIDSGISGKAAERVGSALNELSMNKQVICITHLPQIASMAKHHIYVYKKIKNNKTSVIIKYLEGKEKLNAISELYSSDIKSFSSVSLENNLGSDVHG